MKKGDFYLFFSFFVNNSRMEGPTPVFLSYLDHPYAIEGGSTANSFFLDFHAEQSLHGQKRSHLKARNRRYTTLLLVDQHRLSALISCGLF